MDWFAAGGALIAVRAIHFAAIAVTAGTLVFRAVMARPALRSNPSSAKLLQAQTLRGHWSLLNVWGTWCQECRAEHETLLQIKHQGKVPIFGIDWKDDDTQARAWLSELGNPYERVGADREGRVAIDWGVYGAPESFLINPAGTVVYKHVGALTPQIWQQEFLSRLL